MSVHSIRDRLYPTDFHYIVGEIQYVLGNSPVPLTVDQIAESIEWKNKADVRGTLKILEDEGKVESHKKGHTAMTFSLRKATKQAQALIIDDESVTIKKSRSKKKNKSKPKNLNEATLDDILTSDTTVGGNVPVEWRVYFELACKKDGKIKSEVIRELVKDYIEKSLGVNL